MGDGFISIDNKGFFDDSDGPTIVFDRPSELKVKSINIDFNDKKSGISDININSKPSNEVLSDTSRFAKKVPSTSSNITIEAKEIDNIKSSRHENRHHRHRHRDHDRDSRPSSKPSVVNSWSGSGSGSEEFTDNKSKYIPLPNEEPFKEPFKEPQDIINESRASNKTNINHDDDLTYLMNPDKIIAKTSSEPNKTIDYSSASDSEIRQEKPIYNKPIDYNRPKEPENRQTDPRDIKNFGENQYDNSRKKFDNYRDQDYRDNDRDFRDPPKQTERNSEEYVYVRKFATDQEERSHYIALLQDLERKGITLTSEYNKSTPVSQLKSEYFIQKDIIDQEASIEWYKSSIITTISSIEFGNKLVDPIGRLTNGYTTAHLDGWSSGVRQNIHLFENTLKQLYTKHKGDEELMAPEIKLIGLIFLSGLAYHTTQIALNSGNITNQQNLPTLMMQMAGKMMGSMAPPQQYQQQQPQHQQFQQQAQPPYQQTTQQQHQVQPQVAMSGPSIDPTSLANNFLNSNNEALRDIMTNPQTTREFTDPPLGTIYKKQSILAADDDNESVKSAISYQKGKKGRISKKITLTD